MLKKLHAISLYPAVMLFAAGLKGKKTDYTNFFEFSKLEFEKENYLKVSTKKLEFFDNISKFFDKKMPIYDKSVITFNIDLSVPAEKNRGILFNFIKLINVYHSLSMLSAKLPNENIYVKLELNNQKLNSSNVNILLRYILLIYGSRKVDKLYFDKSIFKDEKHLKAFELLISHLNNSVIQNFSNSQDLFVITSKKDKKTFDIVWSSKRDIELTDFNKVIDMFGNEIKKDIKITQNPIYAYHK